VAVAPAVVARRWLLLVSHDSDVVVSPFAPTAAAATASASAKSTKA
jgi:hypothetical protein